MLSQRMLSGPLIPTAKHTAFLQFTSITDQISHKLTLINHWRLMRILLVQLPRLGDHDLFVVELVEALGRAYKGADEGNGEADGGLKDVDAFLDVG